MPEFDWEQEGYKRLHYLERENADLRREIAYWRKLLSEKESEKKWETRSCRRPQAQSKPASVTGQTA
jgi:hypothetical protein